jgi:DNA-binding SARP family transcriptional activator
MSALLCSVSFLLPTFDQPSSVSPLPTAVQRAAVLQIRDDAGQLAAVLRRVAGDERDALAALEALYPQLDPAAPGAPCLQAAAYAVTALHTGWTRFHSLPIWLARLAEHLPRESDLPSAWVLVRVDCAAVGAAFLGDPNAADAADTQRRLSRALDATLAAASEVSIDELLVVGRVLLDLIEAHNRADRFEPMMMALERRLTDEAPPLAAGRLLLYAGRCYLRFNLQQRNRRYVTRAAAAFARARGLAREHGLAQLTFDVAHAELFIAVTNGDQARVETLLDEMETAIAQANRGDEEPMRLAEYLMERTRVALLHDERDAALALSADCMHAVQQAAVPASQRGPQTLARVWALAAAERVDEAIAVLADYAPATGTTTRTRQVLDCIAALLGALRARRSADEAGYTAGLRDGFTRAAQLRWPNYLASLPRQAALLTADALERDIEVDFLRGAVIQRKLQAPSKSTRHWPWPVQIVTFGGFSLRLAGEPVRAPTGKAQKKPLELLRALAAHGHRGVTSERLADHLWPNSDGAAARAALKVTMMRLRKLLGADAAVELHEGRVTLAEALVHIDTDGFDSVCHAIDAAGEATSIAQLRALAGELVRWYRGSFLDGEEINPLLLGARHRLHARFLRAVAALAALLVKRLDAGAAIELLDAAALIDPVDEDLHRRLIRLLREQGENVRALRAYARLRESLSRTLGVLPGAATQECVAGLFGISEPVPGQPSRA